MISYYFLFQGLLVLIPKQRLKPWYRSGARDFRKTRPLSKSSIVYDTNPIIWPMTEPTPMAEALIQCAGEAKYCNDLPTQPKEVFCAFVTSDICTGEIESIDATPALVSTVKRCRKVVYEILFIKISEGGQSNNTVLSKIFFFSNITA